MIQLIDNYYLDSDEKSYILKERTTRTKRKDNSTYVADNVLGYFNTIKNATNALITIINRKSIYNNEITNLKDCVQQIDDITNKLLQYLK